MTVLIFAVGMLALVTVIITVPLTLRGILRWFFSPPRRRNNGVSR